MIGARINQFQITAKLGQGGMGEVYRATDEKLGRQVAIKLLAQNVTQLPDSSARFEREAKSLASLNHPGIASLFGYELSQGTHFLVMELVEGETLEEKLKRGPLPVEEVIDIGRQMAEAIEAAHSHGVIHRDLKPSNIKITPEGRVKLLDFGLAKAVMPGAPIDSSHADLSQSPTLLLSAQSTLPGVILGTAGYMSPEQIRAQQADHRSDIWAFGVVLFECLTGKKLFSGESISDILAAALSSEINWKLLPPGTPLALELLLRKCLARKVPHRLQTIADARVDLEQAAMLPVGRDLNPPRPAFRNPMVMFVSSIAGLLLLLGGLLIREWFQPPATPAMPQTFSLNFQPGTSLGTYAYAGSSILISPDGSKVVYDGYKDGAYELYWRGINDREFRVIPQTVRSSHVAAFAPGSDRLVFARPDGELKIFSFRGGLPAPLAAGGTEVAGLAWGEDNRILISTTNGISSVHLNKPETRELLVPAQANERFRNVRFLPGGRHVMFSVEHPNGMVGLEAFTLASRQRVPLDIAGSFSFEFDIVTGCLLYGRDDVLWARRFDPKTLQFRGSERPLLNDAGRDWAAATHQFSISRNGTLIYARGHQTEPRSGLVLANSNREPEPVPVAPGNYAIPRVAPDGKSAILLSGNSTHLLVNLKDGAAASLSQARKFSFPKFSLVEAPFAYDGTNYYYNQLEGSELKVISANVNRPQETAEFFKIGEEMQLVAKAISNDRRLLALQRIGQNEDIFVKDLTHSDKLIPIAASDATEAAPAFSPDGRWIAYSSDQSGRAEVYARRSDAGGLPIQISRNSGFAPQWSPDGKKLYFRNQAGLFSVKILSREPLVIEAPIVFSTERFARVGIIAGANYDVISGPDGDRVLFLKSIYEEPEPQYSTHATVIVNFDEHIRKNLPPE